MTDWKQRRKAWADGQFPEGASMPSPEQVEEYIRRAEDEIGPDCGEPVAVWCAEALRRALMPHAEAKPLGWATRTDVENMRAGTYYANFLIISKHGNANASHNVPVFEGPRAMGEGSAAEFVRQAINEKLARDKPVAGSDGAKAVCTVCGAERNI